MSRPWTHLTLLLLLPLAKGGPLPLAEATHPGAAHARTAQPQHVYVIVLSVENAGARQLERIRAELMDSLRPLPRSAVELRAGDASDPGRSCTGVPSCDVLHIEQAVPRNNPNQIKFRVEWEQVSGSSRHTPAEDASDCIFPPTDPQHWDVCRRIGVRNLRSRLRAHDRQFHLAPA